MEYTGGPDKGNQEENTDSTFFAIAIALVKPGLSIPNKLTRP